MPRLTQSDARAIAAQYRIPLESDFYALTSEHVESIIAAADARGYRKPSQANGSRARYFHAYLCRAARFSVVELDGMAAARRGDSRAANPYAPNMPGFPQWESGYNRAAGK